MKAATPIHQSPVAASRFGAIWLLVAGACAVSGPAPPESACTGYPDQVDSPYVLPYPTGSTEVVLQGNCGAGGHRPGETFEYAYDFDMEIGDLVTAARRGVVIGVEERFEDGNGAPADNNYVFIEHEDGTIARYYHLTLDGALVAVGDTVARGDPIGRSGNTGNTGGIRHLHFDVAPCAQPYACQTIPVVFANTRSHPRGLVEGAAYTAGPG